MISTQVGRRAAFRESMEDGPMRAALDSCGRCRASGDGSRALVTADKDAEPTRGGSATGRTTARAGSSALAGGRWVVRLTVDGKLVYFGKCDEEKDAARLVDALRVVVREEAPKNYPQPFVEFLEAGGGDAAAALVAAALLRVGRVDVKGAESVEAAEALDAASSSLAKEIDEAIAADPEMQARAGMKLSDAGYDSGLGTWDTSLRTKWNTAQGGHMEAKGVTRPRPRAGEYGEHDLALALTLCDDTKTAARLLKETLELERRGRRLSVWVILASVKLKNGRVEAERTTPEQDALDVATRWAASRAGTVDDAFATEYAEALAVPRGGYLKKVLAATTARSRRRRRNGGHGGSREAALADARTEASSGFERH